MVTEPIKSDLKAPTEEDQRIVAQAASKTAEILAVTNEELAEILGVPVDQFVVLASDNPRLSEAAFRRALMFVRAAESLLAIVGTGNDQTAQSLIRSPNTILNSKPIDLMRTAEGLDNFVRYLETQRYRL